MTSCVPARALALGGGALLLTISGLQAQTTFASFSMGENLSGAAIGGSADRTFTSSEGLILPHEGSGNLFNANTATTSSTLSVSFNGNGYYTGTSNGFTTGYNFGLEAWVNFSSLATTQWVALAGASASDGVGILFDADPGRLAGVTSSGGFVGFVGSTPSIQTNTWYHVTVIGRFYDDGESTYSTVSFYLNGTELAGSSNLFARADNFSLGGEENGNAPLTGLLDDVRYFTFETGAFTPSMLSYTAAAIPEPSTYVALAGAAALLRAAWRRRRRIVRAGADGV